MGQDAGWHHVRSRARSKLGKYLKQGGCNAALWPREVQNMLCLSRNRRIGRRDHPCMSSVGTACFERAELSTLNVAPDFRG